MSGWCTAAPQRGVFSSPSCVALVERRDGGLVDSLDEGKCAERLLAYARAGAQRIFLWPLADERAQLELFRERVVPLLDGERT